MFPFDLEAELLIHYTSELVLASKGIRRGDEIVAKWLIH